MLVLARAESTGELTRAMHDGLILTYHRIAPSRTDPFGLCVSADRFDAQLRLLKRLAHPLPLAELVERARAGTLPPRAVVLTFDDGYPDTLEDALPILERHEVPATVFLCTGLSPRHEYWWEELASLLLRPGRLPRRLRLRRDGREYVWELGRDVRYGAAAAARHRHWRAFSGSHPTRRHTLFEDLWTLMRPLPPSSRDRLMRRLRAWAILPERRTQARARPLWRPEMRALAASPAIEIGAHTATHPVLARLAPEAQWQEIEQCKRRLEATLGGEVDSFAYPFGARGGYTRETATLVREAGFRLACSTRPGRVRHASNRFALPRVAVGNWSPTAFRRWLRAWTA